MWKIEVFDEVQSTQIVARERLNAGEAGHKDVLVALHQSGGKGQYETRTWYDQPGANLLLSLVLTEVDQHLVELMPFVAGLSVVATIRTILGRELRSFDPDRVRLKWPNDILLDNRKISGILSEAIWSGSSLKGIIVGIGININQDIFSGPIASKAIALKQVLQYNIPIEETRDLLLATFEFALSHYRNKERLLSDIRSEFEWLQHVPIESVTTSTGDVLEISAIDGIADSGALVVKKRDGFLVALQAASLNITLG